jgi:hypothetical protein
MQKADATPPNRFPNAPELCEITPPPPFGSLLAGARARGVADGFAWLGLAAILIDDRGEALHVNPAAVELMGECVYLEGGRLRARDARADYILAAAVRAALDEGPPSRVEIGPASDLVAHVAAMPADPDDPYQLLRVVVLLRRCERSAARH